MRKNTNLENHLIEKGYRLSHKQYGGRKSEKTLSYYYVKKDQYIRLDYKRENVLSYGLLNYQCSELTGMEVEGLRIRLYNIKQDISEKEQEHKKYFEPDIENGEMGEIASGFTPEQFDELCKENE